VLDAYRAPVLGGSAADFVTWALEVPGVTRAWSYPGSMGPGTVGLTFTMDDASYGPIPSAPDVDAVEAHVGPLRPVTAQLFVYAPIALPLVLTLHIEPDLPEVRAEVEAGLRDLLRREAEPGGTILLSHLQETISLEVGETDHVLSSPTANVVAGVGELLVFGSVSYV